VFNQKGGVGKSTITSNLAAIAAASGRRVLVIDLDCQGNTTRYLLGDAADEQHAGSAAFFAQTLKFSVKEVDTADFVVASPWDNLDVMPASAELDEL
ncbi:ParA family protein, partial [Enterobacter cloacae complex sp.6730661]|uniref:ParA family protein n=1 Tax=Enterobacter cloacae complex sp.6730661 TaxID=3397169 RepID=UPI003AAF6502